MVFEDFLQNDEHIEDQVLDSPSLSPLVLLLPSNLTVAGPRSMACRWRASSEVMKDEPASFIFLFLFSFCEPVSLPNLFFICLFVY